MSHFESVLQKYFMSSCNALAASSCSWIFHFYFSLFTRIFLHGQGLDQIIGNVVHFAVWRLRLHLMRTEFSFGRCS